MMIKRTDAHAAIALFSGGLDSILAVKWMQKCGYTVYPVFFLTPYMPPDRAITSAMENGIKLIVRDISASHMAMMQNPVYGFGKHLNPCVDCHALMFKHAGEMMAELGADYLISGEVVGQRPMSQRRDAMNLVGKLSGYRDLLLRPLSQKILADTLPIREGWVKKSDMLDFSGRGRNRQFELAEALGVHSFPAPAGGCLLTDRNFTLRMRDLMQHESMDAENLELIRFGRHFRLSPQCKLIVGRDEQDNNSLERVSKSGIKLFAKELTGPLGILTCPAPNPELLGLALSIFWYYHKKGGEEGIVEVHYEDVIREYSTPRCNPQVLKKYHIAYD